MDNNNFFSFASDGWFPRIGYGSGAFEISTTVDGGRNIDNDFIGQVLGDDKIKYTIKFPALSVEEARQFLRRFDRTQGGLFVQDFYIIDPRTGERARKTMYVGNRSGQPFKVHPNGRPEQWLGVVANLVEV